MVVMLKTLGRTLLMLTVLALGGCQSERVTKANFDRIEIGMTKAEIEAILGQPDNSYQGVLSWNTNHSKTVISVVLDDQGKVSEKNADNL